MDGGTFVMLNFLLVKGPILAIALYQLWSLRHYPKPPERQEQPSPPPAPMGGDRKPLPDCLIPRPLAAPARREERVRELA